MIFVPAEKCDLRVSGRLDPDVILNMTRTKSKDELFRESDNTPEYKVSWNSDRYEVFHKSRICACCGIIGTVMFLDKNPEEGQIPHHFNLYAETVKADTGQAVFILMTKDHIVPVSKDGPNRKSNYQTLCYLCNLMKDDLDLPVERLRRILPLAYRISKSTKALNLTKRVLEPWLNAIHYYESVIQNIKDSLQKATEQNQEKMKEKIRYCQEQNDKLSKIVNQIMAEAQASDKIPSEEKLQLHLADFPIENLRMKPCKK